MESHIDCILHPYFGPGEIVIAASLLNPAVRALIPTKDPRSPGPFAVESRSQVNQRSRTGSFPLPGGHLVSFTRVLSKTTRDEARWAGLMERRQYQWGEDISSASALHVVPPLATRPVTRDILRPRFLTWAAAAIDPTAPSSPHPRPAGLALAQASSSG